jgi:hypothetical protein
LWVIAKTDLNHIVIEIRHLNGAVDINAAAERTARAGRRNRHDGRHPAAYRRRSNGQGTIRALLGGRLRNRMIDRPLSRFRRIDRKDRLIHAIRTQVTSKEPVGAVDLDLLPDAVQL